MSEHRSRDNSEYISSADEFDDSSGSESEILVKNARIVISKDDSAAVGTWSERLEALGASVFKKNQSKALKWSLVAHLDAENKGIRNRFGKRNPTPQDMAFISNLSPLIRWFSIPRIKTISWEDAKDRDLQIYRIHYAMEMASPNADWYRDADQDVSTTLNHLAEENRTTSTDESISAMDFPNHKSKAEEPPERLVINSKRLQRLIDYEFCGGGLAFRPYRTLTLSRPFKMLVCLRDKIKTRVQDFERARAVLQKATETEYVEQYKADPCEDSADRDHQDELSMSLSQLTGWILDFRCLENFMDQYVERQRARLAAAPDVIRFADLWLLFPTGSPVYVRNNNIPQKIWMVVKRSGGHRYVDRPKHTAVGDYKNSFPDFVLDCYHLDYNGTTYVPVFSRFKISSFDGQQATQRLQVVPLLAAVRDKLCDREELLARGRQFKESTKVCHKRYSGRTCDRTPKGDKLFDLDTGALKNVSRYSEGIDSEVMVDFERAIQELPAWRPGDSLPVLQFDDYSSETGMEDPDKKWDERMADEFLEVEMKKWDQWKKEGSEPMEETDVLLLPGRVFAFVLKARRWACLQIGKDSSGREQLTSLQPQDEPWHNLELPQGHKEIVQSLIESHFSKDKSRRIHFDLVKDKGRGIIILLHGVPGVGKTSTAECAAESSGRPLLPITCGRVQATADFHAGPSLDCVMLLDEADIFLAQRSATDTERNALVSVFLRTLEYYEGILFLTTNRVGVFDEAFKSRIHISLYYPPLEEEQTIKIWRAHIDKATQNDRIKADAVELALCANEIFKRQQDPQFGPVWNGRQIRNAFQSAVALAGFHSKDDEPIKLEKKYFKQVFEVSDHFSNYVWTVRQRHSDAQWNMMNMVRRDDWTFPTAMMNTPAQPIHANQGAVHTSHINQASRFGAFPQSTFDQSMPRPITPFGGGMGGGSQAVSSQGILHPQHYQGQQPHYHPQQHQGHQHSPMQVSGSQSNQQAHANMHPSMNFPNMEQQAPFNA